MTAVGHQGEAHSDGREDRLNALRAGVLGAIDGIVSVAGLVMGVAGATTNREEIFVAGIAGLIAGALSMAVGEYVSVATQADSDAALIAKEAAELRDMPELELQELAEIYEGKGLSPKLAMEVALELTAHDALAAHLDAELNLDPEDVARPSTAAITSMVAFALGAALPLLTILSSPAPARTWVTLLSVTMALLGAGYASARLGGGRPGRAMMRVATGGFLAMSITWVIGSLIGAQVFAS